jgi:hypothetical protein
MTPEQAEDLWWKMLSRFTQIIQKAPHLAVEPSNNGHSMDRILHAQVEGSSDIMSGPFRDSLTRSRLPKRNLTALTDQELT